MNWYKSSQSDFFNDLFKDTVPKKVDHIDSPRTEPNTLMLYRSLVSEDLSRLEKSGGQYILNPSTSEQGLLWFSHDLSRHGGVQYVAGRGKYILTYPLECVRHVETIHYDDGSSYNRVPKEIEEKSDPTSNSPVYMGYELPGGWFFSYKMEKFIVCDHPLAVDPSMIQSNEDFETEHELV